MISEDVFSFSFVVHVLIHGVEKVSWRQLYASAGLPLEYSKIKGKLWQPFYLMDLDKKRRIKRTCALFLNTHPQQSNFRGNRGVVCINHLCVDYISVFTSHLLHLNAERLSYIIPGFASVCLTLLLVSIAKLMTDNNLSSEAQWNRGIKVRQSDADLRSVSVDIWPLCKR